MRGGNAFFTDAERKQFREVEGDWDRQHPVEPPRLNDPPAPGKTCGGCELFEHCREWHETLPDDEACTTWEGSE